MKVLKRLDIGRYRALVIFMDGTYKFAPNHSLACTEFMTERGFYPEDKHCAGFLEVSDLRRVSMFVVMNEDKCREVLESDQFKKDLAEL